jgi:hypothetical protein
MDIQIYSAITTNNFATVVKLLDSNYAVCTKELFYAACSLPDMQILKYIIGISPPDVVITYANYAILNYQTPTRKLLKYLDGISNYFEIKKYDAVKWVQAGNYEAIRYAISKKRLGHQMWSFLGPAILKFDTLEDRHCHYLIGLIEKYRIKFKIDLVILRLNPAKWTTAKLDMLYTCSLNHGVDLKICEVATTYKPSDAIARRLAKIGKRLKALQFAGNRPTFADVEFIFN